MTRINPDLWPDDAIVDDLSSTKLRKSWSARKLDVTFAAFLEEHATLVDRIEPTLDLSVTNISSIDQYLYIEAFPSDGVLGVIQDGLKLLDFNSNEVILTSPPIIVDLLSQPGKRFLRLDLPVEILPNTTYTLELDEGTLINGNLYSNAISMTLASSSLTFVKPTFGVAVSIPVDSNHNFLSMIHIPITSNHEGRDLYLDPTKISLVNGTSTINSIVYNSTLKRLELNVLVGSMEPNISYNIILSAEALIDDDLANISTSIWGNLLDTKVLITPPEQIPEFIGSFQTNSLNTNPVEITDIYFPLMDKAYLNLQRDALVFGKVTVNGSEEFFDFIVNPTLKRIELDISTAVSLNANLVPNFFSAENQLLDNTLYAFEFVSGAVIDGAKTNTLESLSFTTDDEANIVLGAATSDTGNVSTGMTEMYVPLLNGPTFSNPPTTNFSGVTINGIAVNINGGVSAIYYDAINQRITIPIQNILPNITYNIHIPADALKDGTSGNAIYDNGLSTLEEFMPEFTGSSVMGSTVNYKATSQVIIQVDNTIAYSSVLVFDPTKVRVYENGNPLVLGSGFSTSYDDALKQILISGLSLKFSTTYNVTLLVDVLKDGTIGNDSLSTFPFTTAARYYYEPTLGASNPLNGAIDVDYVELNATGSYLNIEIDTVTMHDIAYSITPIDLASILTINSGNIIVLEDSNPIAFTADINGTNLRVKLTDGYLQDKTYTVTLGAGALVDVTENSVDLVGSPYIIQTIDAAVPEYQGTLYFPTDPNISIPEIETPNKIIVSLVSKSYNSLSLEGVFPHNITVTGATLLSVALDLTFERIELEVDNANVGQIQVTMGVDSIKDTNYTNDAQAIYTFNAVAAATPVFSPVIVTDTGNNVSFDIGLLSMIVTSDPHSALQLDGSANIHLRRYTSPTAYFEGKININRLTLNMGGVDPVLEIDFNQADSFVSFADGSGAASFTVHSDLVNIAEGYRLLEDQEYKIWIDAGALTDLTYYNQVTLSDALMTDNEINPTFSATIDTDAGHSASLITEFIATVNNGPFINSLVLDNSKFNGVLVLNRSDAGTVSRNGDPTLIYSGGTYTIHVPVISNGILPNKDYALFFPEGLLRDGTSGNGEYTSDNFTVLPEIKPTFNVAAPSGSAVDYHYTTTTDIVIPITNATYSNLQAFPAMLMLEVKPVSSGVYMEITAGINKTYNSVITPKELIISLTDGVLQPDFIYRVTIPSSTVTDGSEFNDLLVHNFQTMVRTESVPIFDFVNATPPDNATGIDPSVTTYIDIPFSSTHELLLTVNDAGPWMRFHLNDGASDLPLANVVMMGTVTNPFIRITPTSSLPLGKSLVLSIDASAIQDGAMGSAVVTAASLAYDITTMADSMIRRTVVIEARGSGPTIYGNSSVSPAYVYASGTRSISSIDLTTHTDIDFFWGASYTADPRQFYFVFIKRSGNTDPGQVITPSILPADSGGGLSTEEGGGVFSVEVSNNRFTLSSGFSAENLYEIVIFDAPKSNVDAQTWVDGQDWSSYKIL